MSDSNPIPGRLVAAVFNKVLRDDLTPQLIDGLKAQGLDLTADLADEYPRDIWFRAIELTASVLFGAAASPSEQQRQLGRHVIVSLEKRKVIKGPWLAMAKLLGPRRALRQAAEFGAEHSPVGLEVTEKNSKALEVVVDEGRQSEFLAGLIEALVGVLGGKDPKVSTVVASEDRVVFWASWR